MLCSKWAYCTKRRIFCQGVCVTLKMKQIHIIGGTILQILRMLSHSHGNQFRFHGLSSKRSITIRNDRPSLPSKAVILIVWLSRGKLTIADSAFLYVQYRQSDLICQADGLHPDREPRKAGRAGTVSVPERDHHRRRIYGDPGKRIRRYYGSILPESGWKKPDGIDNTAKKGIS
mgnify:CR=1 FL=1